MRFKILIPLLVTLLAACQTSYIGNEDSPYLYGSGRIASNT